jgi:N6-L-threonylcarbamoyladenine synthase
MKVLAIETSCDETAVAVIEGTAGSGTGATFTVLGNALLSQIDIHKEYGGVYPMIAKREHAKHINSLTYKALNDAQLLDEDAQAIPPETYKQVADLLVREEGVATGLLTWNETLNPPDIDAIAVTAGPGLEPALWVGVNYAKALSLLWNKPLISVNHMEGHICAALANIDGTHQQLNGTTAQDLSIPNIQLPLLSLLISGGHTELVLSKQWGSFELIGATRDDAVGEAFDKVARMLGLPYPGGPEVSKLAEYTREIGRESEYKLPRPMIHEKHCDFSFSGLKTSVLYKVKDQDLSQAQKEDIAREFEDAVGDVLYARTKRALEDTGAKTLALGGGVSANTHIQRTFRERLAADFPDVTLAIPAPALTTDNAIMIGLAGFYHAVQKDFADAETLRADGNRKLRA